MKIGHDPPGERNISNFGGGLYAVFFFQEADIFKNYPYMTNPISRFTALRDKILRTGTLGLLCNQTSFDPVSKKYLFQILRDRGVLGRLFVPEHGLFAELQDQVALSKTDVYSDILDGVECVSLYGESESTLVASRESLTDLDAIVIDIQDVGSRYYTFATTVSYLFDAILHHALSPVIYIIDRINPAGRQVEGSILPQNYASFVGRPGLLHRHGLTVAELCRLYAQLIGLKLDIRVVELSREESAMMAMPFYNALSMAATAPWMIPPSPNMASPVTPHLYSGQCLLEGTNLSEGRGTTRPFEIFGAPFLRPFSDREFPAAGGAALRPLKFIPTFHKHAAALCEGYQIIPTGPYHSLLHSLRMIRHLSEQYQDFEFKRGVYEFRSDRPAIELLAGDDTTVSYLYGGGVTEVEIRDYFEESEQRWIKDMSDITIYPEKLFQCL
jgi:uncharacterized protein YbbC (DUF1343 family)